MKRMQIGEAQDHELYVDLPVFSSPYPGSEKILLKAQKHVYFIATDREQWIKVRGEDGTLGYIRCYDNKIDGTEFSANEVFSNLLNTTRIVMVH